MDEILSYNQSVCPIPFYQKAKNSVNSFIKANRQKQLSRSDHTFMHLCHNLNESLQGDSKKNRQNGHDFSFSSSYDVCNSWLVSSFSHNAVCFDTYFRLPIANALKVIIWFLLSCLNWQAPTIAEEDTKANFSLLLDPKNNLLFNKFLTKNLRIIIL